MIEIAGGIVLAVAFLCALPFLIIGGISLIDAALRLVGIALGLGVIVLYPIGRLYMAGCERFGDQCFRYLVAAVLLIVGFVGLSLDGDR